MAMPEKMIHCGLWTVDSKDLGYWYHFDNRHHLGRSLNTGMGGGAPSFHGDPRECHAIHGPGMTGYPLDSLYFAIL